VSTDSCHKNNEAIRLQQQQQVETNKIPNFGLFQWNWDTFKNPILSHCAAHNYTNNSKHPVAHWWATHKIQCDRVQ